MLFIAFPANAEALLSKLIEDASKVGTQEVVSKTEPVTSERVASKSAVQSGTKLDGKVSAARKAAIKLTKVDQHSPKQETDRTGKVKVEKSLKHSADGESGSYRPQSSGSKKLGSDLEQDRKRLSGTIEPPAISTPDTQVNIAHECFSIKTYVFGTLGQFVTLVLHVVFIYFYYRGQIVISF